MGTKGPSGQGELVGEGVILKTTGKAITKCLSLGLHLLQDDTLKIRIYTGSVDVVVPKRSTKSQFTICRKSRFSLSNYPLSNNQSTAHLIFFYP